MLAATFVLLAVDAVFPAASELVMLYAGATAAGVVAAQIGLFGATVGSGAAAFVVVTAAGALGYLVGSCVGRWVGHVGGRSLLERQLVSHQRAASRAGAAVVRAMGACVLLGRVLPVIRSFLSIPAGVFAMPLAPHALLTLVGSAVWGFAFAGVGFALGAHYNHFDHLFRYAEYAVVLLVLGLAARALARARRGQAADV